MTKENKKFVGFLLDEKAEAQLRQKAKEEGRTISGQLRVIIEGQLCPKEERKNERQTIS